MAFSPFWLSVELFVSSEIASQSAALSANNRSGDFDSKKPNPQTSGWTFWVALYWQKIGRLRNLHRLACVTHAPLFCECEPPLTVALMPLPTSS
jgi:hypothetical protein